MKKKWMISFINKYIHKIWNIFTYLFWKESETLLKDLQDYYIETFLNEFDCIHEHQIHCLNDEDKLIDE